MLSQRQAAPSVQPSEAILGKHQGLNIPAEKLERKGKETLPSSSCCANSALGMDEGGAGSVRLFCPNLRPHSPADWISVAPQPLPGCSPPASHCCSAAHCEFSLLGMVQNCNAVFRKIICTSRGINSPLTASIFAISWEFPNNFCFHP